MADGLGAVLGRGTTGIVLRRTHADVEYVLMRGGREVDRQGWGGSPGEPRLLAQATGRPAPNAARLLDAHGSPAEVVQHAVVALGLPTEVPALLDGAGAAAGLRVEAKGIAGGFYASVRGDFSGPRGQRWAVRPLAAAGRHPSGWVPGGQPPGRAAQRGRSLDRPDGDGDLPGVWRLLTGVLCALGLLSCLWNVRPPRRSDPDPVSPPRERTPTG